jgi:ABC-type multidrug transport system fused ATPase/permease subunit
VIVIDNGTKIEEGSHEELLKLEGRYSEIYHKQLDEQSD